MSRRLKRCAPIFFFSAGIFFVLSIKAGLNYTSSDEFCDICHVHPHATVSWKQGGHMDTESGTVVHCVDCHLPPGGFSYLREKIRSGSRDLYSTLFKDASGINWEKKSARDYAIRFTYDQSCIHCHRNLFSKGLSKKGEDAHLYYETRSHELRCINCHLETGHYSEKPAEPASVESAAPAEIFTMPARVDSFVHFTEQIPGTAVCFEMIAIPGGIFSIGSPGSEAYREPDEGPVRQVRIRPFWMGRAEVSWDEYEAFLRQKGTEGRSSDHFAGADAASSFRVITGPTPAYGNPDQGWGKGKRPAITMTHYAASRYCEWLSEITGRKYRLPTEAEWEYAARGNTSGPYFFGGDPAKYTTRRFRNRLFGPDTSVIGRYVVYSANSQDMSHPPDAVRPNPFGLLHMLGNVKEFCADRYDPNAYERHLMFDPKGPDGGAEHVVRGGSFRSDASMLRAADRDHTRSDAWMITDPQMPKSPWWYSDTKEVGFRVVCEYQHPVSE